MIRSQILDGALRPGAVVDQEALARLLDLSSTPVREALRRLEAEGLLVQSAHRQTRVSALSRRELEEMYDVRLVLDPYAAKVGAGLAHGQEKQALKELLASFDPASSYLEQLQRNRDLHRILYAASRNTVLVETLDGLWDRFDRYRAILIREHMTASTAEEEHAAIVEAFIDGDGVAVSKLMRVHLARGRDAMLRHLGDSDFTVETG